MPPEEVFTAAPPGAPHPALPPACNHTKISSEKHRWQQRERLVRIGAQWWQRGEIPSGIQPRISSERRRPVKLFGGG
jgi:hypothetical protein